MRSSVVLSACVAVALSVVCPSSLWAADGVLLVQTIDDGASTTAKSTQVHMEPNRIRTEAFDGDGRLQVVIFDGVAEVLYIVDVAGQTYVEMTKADAERMGSMLQGAMAMLEQQFANLPEDQRAALAGRMGGAMAMAAGASAARTEYRRNGTDTVAGHSCDRYDGYTSGKKTSEICTVDPAALGFAVADFAVLTKLSDFVRSIVPQMAQQIVGVGTSESGYSGLPVRTVTTNPRSGRPITMQLGEVRRATFEDEIFQVPSGFQKQSLLPSMGQ